MTELGSPESSTLNTFFDFVIFQPSMLCSIPMILRLRVFKRAVETNNFKDFFPKNYFPSSIITSETIIHTIISSSWVGH